MISIDDLLNIICTEALEYSGVQEVPDLQYGSTFYYHDSKRSAREANKTSEPLTSDELPPIAFTLEVVEGTDGKPKLVE
ncbi:MAG TPA: hypothetical protein ENH29_05535 [Bacteroidetes bacterium]|nr:hypothetical protein [Bacteroidota bacterium]